MPLQHSLSPIKNRDFILVNSILANFTQDGRYVPYQFERENLIWTTPHNKDHRYIGGIIAFNINGKLFALLIRHSLYSGLT